MRFLQDASQARQFERIDFRGSTPDRSACALRLALWSSYLEDRQRIGRFIKEILVIPSHDVSKQLLLVIKHLPNLERLEWVAWSGKGFYPPSRPSDRPALRSLKLTLHDRGDPCEMPSAYFDLSLLRVLEINTPDNQRHTERLLRDVSEGLMGLSVLNFECEDLPVVMQAIRRFKHLTDLSLIIWRSTSALPADLLTPFHSLRRLKLAHDDIGTAFSQPLASLELLVISYPPDDWPGVEEKEGFPPSHPLARNVATVCQLVKDHPTHFPALKAIGLDPPYEAVSFATKASQQTIGLAAMAEQVQKTGLRLLDAKGVVWQRDCESAV